MSSYFELLLRFDPNGLRDAAKSWRGLSSSVREADIRHRSQVNGPLRHMKWSGKDAEYAFSTLERTEQILEIVRVESAAVALALDTVADRMYQAQTNLRNAVHRAEEWGLSIASDGTVNLPVQSYADQHDADGQADRKALVTLRGEAQERVNKALTDAREASDKGDLALSRLDADILTRPRVFGAAAETARDVRDVEKDLGLTSPYIPENTDPQKSADWWKSLTPEQQAGYLALHPDQVGQLDGLPSTVRDEANRLVLEQQLDELKSGDARGSGLTFEEYNKREGALRELKERLDQQDGESAEKQLFLLGLDAKGDGKAIVALGNPDTADHTAVMVPGTGTTLASMPGQITRVTALQDSAIDAGHGNKNVSVISWLGYDAPEIPPESLGVMGTGRANDGAEAMRRFTTGTRVAQGDHHSHLTVIGHSYGTTAVGAAAAGGQGLGADDIVAIASPGMTVTEAEKLHIDPSHFWVGAADDDNIRKVAGLTLGDDPMFEGFGGNNIQIDTSGHSGYWDENSQSLANQGRIIAGQPPNTVPKEAEVDPNVAPGI
ncbi:alpha/beta hydrolase [Kitasatospora misakiensis]|uniref:Alpha/beta hydrolase n=1 Tax=Kitasatospora misakiensis TaxID=67330 RepID=A0ABW0XFZ4_9ACTN